MALRWPLARILPYAAGGALKSKKKKKKKWRKFILPRVHAERAPEWVWLDLVCTCADWLCLCSNRESWVAQGVYLLVAFFFFFNFVFYWSIVNLQCCVTFRCGPIVPFDFLVMG